MTTQDERRKDYVDIGKRLEEVGKQLATSNANLTNVIEMFKTHLEDDKREVSRVNTLAERVSYINGKILGFSALGGTLSAVIVAIISSLIKAAR